VPDQYGWNGFPFENQLFPGRPAASYQHNFHFTSEVQYWFKYEADTQATLTFLGDDDVWVFINGRLAVDLGGVHVPSTGTVTINAANQTVNATMQDGRGFPPPYDSPAVNRPGTAAQFGLEPGNVYLITIFHAERQVDGSSFQLTLSGFEATPSECTAICNDGILSFGEECDDGVNDGGYGECNPGCVLGPFCGDGVAQTEFGESCDVGPIGDSTCRGCRRLQIQ
jgi:fibro-slime domain-containing protein